jgi:hypothetical protein
VLLVAFANKDVRRKFLKRDQTLFRFTIHNGLLDSGPHATNHHLDEDELNRTEEKPEDI